MRNQAEKIFLNFFLKGQGSLALYQIPLVSESKGKGWTHELCRTAGSDSGSAVHKAARYIPQPGI